MSFTTAIASILCAIVSATKDVLHSPVMLFFLLAFLLFWALSILFVAVSSGDPADDPYNTLNMAEEGRIFLPPDSDSDSDAGSSSDEGADPTSVESLLAAHRARVMEGFSEKIRAVQAYFGVDPGRRDGRDVLVQVEGDGSGPERAQDRPTPSTPPPTS